MKPWRMVRLVVAGEDGEPVGITDERRVDLPWWQEMAPVRSVFPGAVVLRMLSVDPEPGERAGGSLVYVAQLEGEVPPLEPWPGALPDHPLRMPWARPGGPSADLAWVESVAPASGPPRQFRSWNLSSIWTVPTSGGDVWLKCVAPFFEHEAAVLRVLADQPVPKLLAADSHRLLLAPLDGVDGYEASDGERRALVDTLVDIQLTATDRVDALLSGGVPDFRWPSLGRSLADLISRRAPGDERLATLLRTLDDRFAAVDTCGLPTTLVHGDAHAGNSRIGGGRPVVLDWGDSFVGHPLLDLAVLGDDAPELVGYWLDRWRERVPGSDPHRAWRLLEPVAALRAAWVYQMFLDRIEPSEHPYHRHDVEPAINRAVGLLTARGRVR